MRMGGQCGGGEGEVVSVPEGLGLGDRGPGLNWHSGS